MMLAPVYRTINTTAVQAIIGNPPRIHGSGLAPEGVQRPYVTWFTVSDIGVENLSGPPPGDVGTIQIDCWAGPADDQERVCMNLAAAVRTALDAANIVNRVVAHSREPDTRLFRIGLQADFIRNR